MSPLCARWNLSNLCLQGMFLRGSALGKFEQMRCGLVMDDR